VRKPYSISTPKLARARRTFGEVASGHHAKSDRVIQTSGKVASGHHAISGRVIQTFGKSPPVITL
jgi:hypothetical protein